MATVDGLLLLVSGATRTMGTYAGHPNLGILAVPADGNVVRPKVPWAADNGCFGGFDQAAFERFLLRISGVPNCLFVTAPDSLADAQATLALFDVWEPKLHAAGWPVAFVAQDGLTNETTPWRRMDALFLGGTTGFKIGATAAQLVRSAKTLGLWVHMGRVNTMSRLKYAAVLGCDSVDGSKYSRWSETHIPRALAYLETLSDQRSLCL